MPAFPELGAPEPSHRAYLSGGQISRRTVVRAGLAAAGVALGSVAAYPEAAISPDTKLNSMIRKSRIRQSVCRWCYAAMPLDSLCTAAAQMGLYGIDLLQPEEYSVPRRYGLVCTMGYAGAGEIANGLNRVEHHAAIEAGLRKNLPLAARAGVERVITFSGNRDGISDTEGLKNTVIGLKRMVPLLDEYGITLCMELLNSKVNHPDYMADHSAWGVAVMEQVNSPRVKLLYDIYHMQIMEGDLITTIRQNITQIAHFHTGGVPGRHELNDAQEVQWNGVMRAIAEAGFAGYVAHEFLPQGDPLVSLRQAVELCAV